MITKRTALVRTMLRLWAGRVLNAIGVPGVVQPGTYEAGLGQASVRITVGPLFTVVTVNGVDIYLDRFTGAVDGVGFGVASGCRLADTPRPAHSALLPTMVAETSLTNSPPSTRARFTASLSRAPAPRPGRPPPILNVRA